MKRIILFIGLILFLVVIGYFKFAYGWFEFRGNTDTPRRFLSTSRPDRSIYSKDSSHVIGQLSRFLKEQRGFFNNTAYYKGTQIIIDTIVYSPDYKKMGVLIITKNQSSRLLAPDGKHDLYYDATCYLGVKGGDTVALTWVGPNLTNSYSMKDISNDLRLACFRTFVSKDTTGPISYQYNLNDIRFWNSSIWNQIDSER
jgi:hypothetical protein